MAGMHLSFDGTGIALFGLGFALGIRHALDPDHLVAVSTIVSRNKSIARSSVAGAFWGVGHTASLLVCGSVVLALRMQIPDSFIATAERAVALMLVLLGCECDVESDPEFGGAFPPSHSRWTTSFPPARASTRFGCGS
jgi:ABC-type nickel/cobalt efflux system permease component RcnA